MTSTTKAGGENGEALSGSVRGRLYSRLADIFFAPAARIAAYPPPNTPFIARFVS